MSYCSILDSTVMYNVHETTTFALVFQYIVVTSLCVRLEELRKLNYSLDVELQRERNQRVTMQDRVMAPRNRHANQETITPALNLIHAVP